MATLKYTIAITSADAFAQAVSFSKTSTLDVDGDASIVGERQVSSTAVSLLPLTDEGTVAIESRAFVYVRNDGATSDPNIEIVVQDGDGSGTADVMTFKPGEQGCFLYQHEDGSAKDILIKSGTSSTTAYYSYAFVELT